MTSSLHVWRVELLLQPSRIALVLVVLLHAAAAFAVFSAALSPWWRVTLVASTVVSLTLALRHQRQQAGLVVREHGTAWWLQRGQEGGAADLLRTRVWRALVVMDFCRREGRGRRHVRVVVLPDAVPSSAFRRLRVRLRQGPHLLRELS